MSSARIYRPVMIAFASVPVLGSAAERRNEEASKKALDLTIIPTRVRVVSNNHLEADTCSITADWLQAGVDPRMLDDAVIEMHIDTRNEFFGWQASRENCRFIGVLKENGASREVGKAGLVTFDAVDYTDFFLRSKPGAEGVPLLKQTLPEAWRTIVAHTPGAAIFADKLVFEGEAEGIAGDGLASTPIGKAAAERFRKHAQVQVEPDSDAWAIWQQCVGMLGLISFIRLDECVVTTATNYYTATDPPKLVYGKNLLSWSERRNADVAKTGIALTSFDALTQRTIEAYWPPIGDPRAQKKKTSAKSVRGAADMLQREKRDYFPYPGITDPDALTLIAKRVYEERSRQELSGRCSTAEMRVERASGADFDLLSLHAGDSVTVQIDPENQQLLAALPVGARVPFLVKRGYTEDIATLLVANMAEFAELGSTMHVRSVETELELDENGGSFRLNIEYCNAINIEGSAAT